MLLQNDRTKSRTGGCEIPGRPATVLILILTLLPASSGRAANAEAVWQSKPTGNARLVQRIVAILQSEGAREAVWGIQAISLPSGEPILSWNQDKLFAPASAAKLFTTAAALVRLGPDFKYRTTAEITGPIDQTGTVRGDLIVFGRGDPNLSARVLPYQAKTERSGSPTRILEALADQISARGIKVIEGDFVLDDSYFVHQPYGEDWTAGDLVWGFGAPVSALAVNDDVVTLHIRPGARAVTPAVVQQEPLEDYYEIVNRIVTVNGREGPAARRISIDRQPGSHILMLWGQIPETDPGLTESVAMDDPARFAVEFFRQELRKRNIAIHGTFRVRHLEPFEISDLHGAAEAATSAPSTVVAAHESEPLVESLKVIEKVSQNLHAEMLLRTLGRERRNLGSIEAGLDEVQQFLFEIGVTENQRSTSVALYDGSGLSRETLVSPSATVKLLERMYNSKYRAQWLDLLPIAGVDGSLADRFQSGALAGRIHAKTGSMAGVGALAGYIVSRNQPRAAFAIFVNNAKREYEPLRGDRFYRPHCRGNWRARSGCQRMNGEELEMLKSNLISSQQSVPRAQPNTSAEDLRRRMLDYLATHNSMTIASCHQNVPWASAVFFVNDDFDLYFLSNPQSRHGSNMAANSAVSAAIHEDYHDWGEIRGIQLEGRSELVRSAKVKLRFWGLYEKKFPFVEAFFRPGKLQQIVEAKLAGIRLYRIVPTAVWYLDNSRGFGHREYLPLAEAEAVSD